MSPRVAEGGAFGRRNYITVQRCHQYIIPDRLTTAFPAKMKVIAVLACLAAACLAAPAPQHGGDKDAIITRYESDNIGLEGYKFAIETSNGISQEEEGQLQNVGSENELMVVRGQYSYTGPDGQVYTVTYIADENGFQPQGAHLPVA